MTLINSSSPFKNARRGEVSPGHLLSGSGAAGQTHMSCRDRLADTCSALISSACAVSQTSALTAGSASREVIIIVECT